jgi:hypothetical protein
VSVEKMSGSKPTDDASSSIKELSKLEPPSSSRMSREGACLLARRQSVYRRHELSTGFGAERENLALDEKGNDKWLKP